MRTGALDDRGWISEDARDDRRGRHDALEDRGRARRRERRRLGAELGGGARGVAAVGRLRLEQPADERVRLGGCRGGRERERRRRLVRAAKPGGESVLALERHPAGQQPEQDAAERVQVGSRSRRRPGCLFGRPVLGGPGKDPGDRSGAGGAREPGEAEVRHDDAARAVLHEDVRGCQVTMDDAAGVRVGERGRDRRAVPARLVPAERAAANHRVEADAVDELHDEHGLAAFLEHVVEADDVRVLEPRERGGLALEPLAKLGIVRDPGVEDLERHVPAEALVAGAPHDAHSSLAELIDQPVAVSDDGVGFVHA